MGFCSVSDVSTFLGTTLLATNAQVLQAISEASTVIQNYCNQKIEQISADAILLDGAGSAKLFLPELPVTTITSVKVDGVLLASTDYALAENGVLWRNFGVWAIGARNVEVTYTHGYAVIPADIKGVCYRSAARLYQAQLKATHQGLVPGLQAVSVGDWSETYEGDKAVVGESDKGVSAARTLLMSEKDILNYYRYKRL
jgi:hypothetical protein